MRPTNGARCLLTDADTTWVMQGSTRSNTEAARCDNRPGADVDAVEWLRSGADSGLPGRFSGLPRNQRGGHAHSQISRVETDQTADGLFRFRCRVCWCMCSARGSAFIRPATKTPLRLLRLTQLVFWSCVSAFEVDPVPALQRALLNYFTTAAVGPSTALRGPSPFRTAARRRGTGTLHAPRRAASTSRYTAPCPSPGRPGTPGGRWR